MLMKNPPHPGLGLRDEFDALAITVAQAAAGLGVTRQQLYRVMKGESAITPEMAIRLEQGVGSSADTWLRMQLSYDLAQARRRTEGIKVRKFEMPASL